MLALSGSLLVTTIRISPIYEVFSRRLGGSALVPHIHLDYAAVPLVCRYSDDHSALHLEVGRYSYFSYPEVTNLRMLAKAHVRGL